MLNTREAEPWVDLRTVARHLNCGYAMVRKMADDGVIPCFPRKSGKMTYRFFKISAVDAAMSSYQQATR